jgi:pyruvate/2-oxoglutarate dehydrogenase complex dihydrolipoamide acyltransferase (E2) component
MSTNIVVPHDLWEGDTEAVVTAWLARDGAPVQEGALIAEIMVEKAQNEIRSPSSGRLTILAAVDEIVHKGSIIGRVG